MRHEHDNARRHAENTIAEANRHLDSGKIKNPRHHQMLTAMIKDATDTLRNIDDMENRRPYSDTRIGYDADMRRRRSMADDAMDMVNRILPHISDDYDDYDDEAETRRGVPGTGPYSNPRLRRRGGRKGIGRRRSEMDRYADDDIDFDDDMEARRRRGKSGRFIRGDIDDMRYEMDDARRAADEVRRTADDARRTADDARRAADDVRNIYPGRPPVMPHGDRQATNSDDRYNRTDDRSDRVGPDMRR